MKNIKTSNFFMLWYIIYFISVFFKYTTVSDIFACSILLRISRSISYIGFCAHLCIISRFYVNRKFIFLVYITLCAGLLFLIKKDNTFLLILLMSYSSIYINKECYLHIIYRLMRFLFALTIGLSFFGIICNNNRIEYKYGHEIERISLGFNYSGQMQIALMTLTILGCYLYIKQKHFILKTLFFGIVAGMINIVAYFFGRTIAPTIIALGAIVFLLPADSKKKTIFYSRCITFVPWLCALIEALFTYLYSRGGTLGYYSNIFLNNRPMMNAKAYSLYGITLLGTEFQNRADFINLDNYFVLDSEYSYSMFKYGILYSIVLLIIMQLTIRYAQKLRNVKLVIVFLLYSLFLIIDNGFFDYAINPFAIYIGSALWTDINRRITNAKNQHTLDCCKHSM